MSKHAIKFLAYTRGVISLSARLEVPIVEAHRFTLEIIRDTRYSHTLTSSPWIGQLYELAQKHGGLPKATEHLENKVRAQLFDAEKKSHISLEDSFDSRKEDRGKLFIRKKDETGKGTLELADEKEILEANVFAVGGIDFDTRRYMGALLKSVEGLKEYCVDPHPLWYCKPLALHPYVSKKERYDAAVKYSLDKSFFPPYALEFIEKVILPRMPRNCEGKFKVPDREITFYSYSVGGREVFMLENALRYALKIKGHTKQEIYEIFGKFKGVSLAYAVDVEGIGEDVHFFKVIIFNTADNGVLIPRKTFQLIRDLLEVDPGIDIRKLSQREELSYGQHLIFMSDVDSTFPWHEDSFMGHGLNSYVKAIGKFRESEKELIALSLFSSADCIENIGLVGQSHCLENNSSA